MDKEKYELLLASARAYYSGGKYLIDDAEYDSLLLEMLQVDPNFNIFKEIGYLNNSDDDNLHHMIEFPEFHKYYIKEDVLPNELLSKSEYAEYLSDKTENGALWFYKYDGCSLILYYDPSTGVLQNIITRSDEVIGKNRFNNFVRLVPKTIPIGIRAILCEVMIPLKHGFNYTSRNKANGLTSSKYKIDEINELCTIVGCNIIEGKVLVEESPGVWSRKFIHNFKSQLDKYNLMQTIPNKVINGRISFHIAAPVDLNAMNSYVVKELVTQDDVTELLEYRVDGVVMYPNNLNEPIEAYKAYYIDAVDTKILRINWVRSEKELLVPTAIIDPVEIEGSLVQQVALNSAFTMIEKGLAAGANIRVAKIGMTIPQIIKNYDSHLVPDLGHCDCGYVFTPDDAMGAGLLCGNPDCHMKLATRRIWYSGIEKDELMIKIRKRPGEYLLSSLNLIGVTPKKVHWEDSDLNIIEECIRNIDVKTYVELLSKYYPDITTERRLRSANINAKSVLTVYNEILND